MNIVKRPLFALIGLCCVLNVNSFSNTPPVNTAIKRIIVFGDSLSDDGNDYPTLTRTPCYPMYPMPNLVSNYIHLDKHSSLTPIAPPNGNDSTGPNYPVYFDNRCADHTNLNQHVYFDDVHPSAKLHCMMALTACYSLMQQGYQRLSLIYDKSAKPLNCHITGNIEQKLQMAASYCLAHRVLLPETT